MKCTNLNIVENIGKNLFFRDSEMRVVVFWVGAHVYYSIHVQIQIVEFGYL